jgi:hypothetical protein
VAISGLSGFCRDDISWPALSSLDLVAVRTLGHSQYTMWIGHRTRRSR